MGWGGGGRRFYLKSAGGVHIVFTSHGSAENINRRHSTWTIYPSCSLGWGVCTL